MNTTEKRKNSITRYAMYKLEERLSKEERKSFDVTSATIEHITPESSEIDRDLVLNIGNLLILEKGINEDCDTLAFKEKCTEYRKSNYTSVKRFLEKYGNKEEFSITERSKEIGDILYTLITTKWLK